MIEETGPQPIVTERAGENSIIIETTYDSIPTQVQVVDINEVRRKLSKIDGAIAQWEAKRKPFQDVLDKYNLLYVEKPAGLEAE